MKDLLIQVFSISLMGGGAVLLVWAVAALLRKVHAPSQLLCLLWLVCGARFCCRAASR